MNILMFNYEYPPLGGGGGVIHQQLAEALAQRHRVGVITTAFDGLPRHETLNGVDVWRVPVIGRTQAPVASTLSMLTYPPGACLRAAALLRRESFDVVNGHFAVPTGPASLLGARLGHLPHVLSLHGGDLYDPSKRLSPHRIGPLRWAVNTVLAHSDAVVAQSNNTRDNAYRYYRYRGPIEVIPLGIQQPHVAPATRRELGLPSDAFLLVTVGRLLKRKRLEDLLQALSRPGVESIHLAIVGEGPERDRLHTLSASLGLAPRITFTDHVAETTKWQILFAADAYVSSTMHEGFGLVYLEAMAAGLPVITYDEGGQMDFLADGQTGRIVPQGDIEALARVLAWSAGQRAELRRMGNANRERARAYDVERCAERYEELFGRLTRNPTV